MPGKEMKGRSMIANYKKGGKVLKKVKPNQEWSKKGG